MRFRHLPRCLRKLLMGQGQTDAVGDMPRHGQIPHAERVWLSRPETDAQLLKAWRDMRDQERPIASGKELFPGIDWFNDRKHLVGEVANQGESSRRKLARVTELHSLDDGTVIIRGGMLPELVLTIGESHCDSIVGQHCRHDFGYARKHFPDVEHVRQRIEQIFGHA